MPSLYAAWLRALGLEEMDTEVFATCTSCAMCAPGTEGSQDPHTFDPAVKCCSYLPVLPNFAVGLILGDQSLLEGCATIRARMQDLSSTTPLGLSMRADYRAVYESSSAFGRGRTLTCPHYVDRDGGLCAIWPYRNSTCATWFCKHVRGKKGQQVWTAIRRLLHQLEADLAIVCALEMDQVARLGEGLAEIGNEVRRDAITRALVAAEGRKFEQEAWGEWRGSTDEYYLRCADTVRSMTWSEIRDKCGAALQARIRDVRLARDALKDSSVPERLIMGSFNAQFVSPAEVKVSTYSPYDAIVLPKTLLAALMHFDGRPTRDIVRTIAEREQLDIDHDTLRQLVDHVVLRTP